MAAAVRDGSERRVADVGTSAALSVVIMAGTVAGLFPPRGHRGDEAGGRLGPPGLSLAAVTTAIYINQVLFTAYVIRVRHGDPSFIARYLPPGWFALARGPAVAALAHHFPDPGLLAPTVLRVQAFLELPNQSPLSAPSCGESRGLCPAARRPARSSHVHYRSPHAARRPSPPRVPAALRDAPSVMPRAPTSQRSRPPRNPGRSAGDAGDD